MAEDNENLTVAAMEATDTRVCGLDDAAVQQGDRPAPAASGEPRKDVHVPAEQANSTARVEAALAARQHTMVAGKRCCVCCHVEADSACAYCRLCSSCCAQGVVALCPSLGNGGRFHQHCLEYKPKRSLYCAIGSFACEHDGPGWGCAQGCRFEVCVMCAQEDPPKSWAPTGRQREQDTAWVITCPCGQTLPSQTDQETRNCSMCGVARQCRRCPSGCGFQVCDECYQRVSRSSTRDFDPGVAELRAAQEWRSGTSVEGIVVGAGAIEQSSGRTVFNPPQRRAANPVVPRPKPAAQRKGVFAKPVPLNRHLSAESRTALDEFAMGMRASADVAMAEQLLTQGASLGEEAHKHLRAAIASGDLGLASQFVVGASLTDTLEQECSNIGGPGESCCPICADALKGPSVGGGVVGCLNGHLLHAACATDLLLGGGVCPTCRAPLFFPEVAPAVLTWHEAKSPESPEAHSWVPGDCVLIHPDKEHCAELQVQPGAGGWNDDMASACNNEGVVVAVVDVGDSITTGGNAFVRAVEVQCKAHTWQWHPELLMLIAPTTTAAAEAAAEGAEGIPVSADGAEAGNTTQRVLPETAQAGAAQVARLRNELAQVKTAREIVRENMMKELGLSLPGVNAIGGPNSVESVQFPPPPLELQRHLSRQSARTVSELRTLSVAPVDLQRARHLLTLAKSLGNDSTSSRVRESLYPLIVAGDLDSAARQIRQHNLSMRVDHSHWKDAVRPTSSYRVAPGVRVELLARAKRNAPRTGFILAPGTEFVSTRELLDVDGNMWLRVGTVTEAKKCAKVPPTNAVEGTEMVNATDIPQRVGHRVLRGRDWEWDTQDGGPGMLGTLTGRGTTEGWVDVEWDSGERNTYRAGAGGHFDLVYAVQDSISAMPPPQGWLQVRPAGPGSARCVAPIHGALRCFACCEDLTEPFRRVSAQRQPFTSVAANHMKFLKTGDVLLVAATLERVIVEQIMDSPSRESEGSPWVIVCRFASGATSDDRKIAAANADDPYVFRPEDLIWPSPPSLESQDEEEMRACLGGQPRSRRELTMAVGLEEAKRAWKQGPPRSPIELEFASCIRGHYLHARCFQGLLTAGKGCPACGEAFFVPGLQRERRADDDEACCGRDAREVTEAEVLQAVEETTQSVSNLRVDVTPIITGKVLKMCPLCYSGPLLNENCADLQAHHGQCPRCSKRPFTPAVIAQKIAQGPEARIGDRIPRCDKCQVAVFFNGCAECGHLFAGTSWTSLPDYDPKAKCEIQANDRYLRTMRMLAAQVRAEAALLEHERAALTEVQAGGGLRAQMDFEEEPVRRQRCEAATADCTETPASGDAATVS